MPGSGGRRHRRLRRAVGLTVFVASAVVVLIPAATSGTEAAATPAPWSAHTLPWIGR